MTEDERPVAPAAPPGFLPSLPETATQACGRYVREVTDLIGFVAFVAELATRSDELRRIATEALGESSGRDEESDQYEATPVSPGEAVQKLRGHRDLLLQMMLSRAVDNFLTYLSELLALVFRSRPETLRSSEMVRLDEVLQHDSMDELVNTLADRRVTRLAYLGMRDLSDDLAEKLDLRLFEDEADLERAVEVIEIRNLIAHSRGVVNQTFLRRVPRSEARESEAVALDFDRVLSELQFLTERVIDIDQRVASKFSLPTAKTST